MQHTFFHKSHKPQEISADPKWTNLEFRIGTTARRKFTCAANGVLESALYLPVEFKLATSTPAVLRVRLIREAKGNDPEDPTGYDERVLTPNTDGFARVRFHYLGEAEKGRTYFWQAQMLGKAKVTATGTHYCQFTQR